jgi:hypothetical protein
VNSVSCSKNTWGEEGETDGETIARPLLLLASKLRPRLSRAPPAAPPLLHELKPFLVDDWPRRLRRLARASTSGCVAHLRIAPLGHLVVAARLAAAVLTHQRAVVVVLRTRVHMCAGMFEGVCLRAAVCL